MESRRLCNSIRSAFGVEFIDFDRSDGLLISSGAGIAMGLMDTLPAYGFMLDIDSYRNRGDVDCADPNVRVVYDRHAARIRRYPPRRPTRRQRAGRLSWR